MSIHSMMNTTVTIKTGAQTKSVTGYNSTTALTVVASNVPARVSDQKPDQAVLIYGNYDSVKQKRVYLDTDQSLQPVISWIQIGGSDYNVVSSMDQGGKLKRLWAVDVLLKPFMP